MPARGIGVQHRGVYLLRQFCLAASFVVMMMCLKRMAVSTHVVSLGMR